MFMPSAQGVTTLVGCVPEALFNVRWADRQFLEIQVAYLIDLPSSSILESPRNLGRGQTAGRDFGRRGSMADTIVRERAKTIRHDRVNLDGADGVKR